MATSARQWLERFAQELGTVPPSPEETEQVLAVAGTAAHASERAAAPISCWLAARAGVAPDVAMAAAGRTASLLEEEAAACPGGDGQPGPGAERPSTRSGQE